MRLADLFASVTTETAAPIALDTEITGITCDSRRVTEGCVFVCIRGAVSDGHDYAADAVRGGAVLIVTQHTLGLPNEWVFADTHAVWVTLCKTWFGDAAQSLRLIGVTGTNGKTTVTHMIKNLLERAGHTVGLIGTIQHVIGDEIVPSHNTTPGVYELQELFAKMKQAGCDTAVMEVSSHALDQGRVDGCHFDAAVFTNLTQDHLDYHGTMERYLEAKKQLFFRCDCAVINADDAWTPLLTDGIDCPIVKYSVNGNEARYTAHGIQQRPDGIDFELVGAQADEIGQVHLPIPGLFSVYNALAAASCVMALGQPFADTVTALGAVQGVKGRAEIVPTSRDFTVVIDYAHTPDGLENICRTLGACKTGRLITVFGCGGDRDTTKRPQMGAIAARLSDLVVVTSDNPRSEEPMGIIADILEGMRSASTPYHVEENRTEAIRWALTHAQTGDTVLLAGKGHETYQILKDGTIHLDEREIVAEVLGETGKEY